MPIASGGVFSRDGSFVHISNVDLTRCVMLWREKVFELLLHEDKITQEIVESMRQWMHSGSSIDN
jgi:hypothetical protein